MMKQVIILLAGITASLASFAQFSLGVQATSNAAGAHVQLQDVADMNKK